MMARRIAARYWFPPQAIVAPYRLDARRCISYLTIEHEGAIALELRPLMGNRIYGCDDCQLACPWNKYAQRATLNDFDTRQPLGSATLLQLWAWDEAQFLHHTEGSAIRRIGLQRWRRNIAVALGNALREATHETVTQATPTAMRTARQTATQTAIETALQAALPLADELLAEHIRWALAQRGA